MLYIFAMLDALAHYWPHILAAISLVTGTLGAVHAAMTKEDVRSAIGWVGVIVLSPLVGAAIYLIAGINRIRRASILQHHLIQTETGRPTFEGFRVEPAMIAQTYGNRFSALKTLGDRVTKSRLVAGNAIDLLGTGDEAYAAIRQAIEGAERSILLETYIFDRDRIGLRIASALVAAVQRGVTVRVLVDAVGARYSVPSILGHLRKRGVTVDVFNGNVIMGLRLPYANLRTHRKIIVVDGAVAFTGGMNIREGFAREFAGELTGRDTHFRLRGPVVADLFAIAAEDWRFASGEALNDACWTIAEPACPPGEGVLMRVVASGPDRNLETNHKMLMGAFSVARRSIRIMSPYFLPDRELISALITAARRGVEVDIVVPAKNNLTLVDHAMTGQFDQLLKHYCRIWRAEGNFDHSKLLSVDGCWAYVGSSNLDPRSLRLNFEVDIEVLDTTFSTEIEMRIGRALAGARAVTLEGLRSRPFPLRLIDRILWLGSPYL